MQYFEMQRGNPVSGPKLAHSFNQIKTISGQVPALYAVRPTENVPHLNKYLEEKFSQSGEISPWHAFPNYNKF